MENDQFTLLAVHAHPDDESIGTGGILAKYASLGVKTVVVYGTRGEEGDILNPEFVAPGPDMPMENIRGSELENALKVLGVSKHFCLGYRDSGMVGTPANENPASFNRADLEEATAKLVDIIREIRPHVLVTYNERGGYGHPDHVMTHRVTVLAFDKSGDPGYKGFDNGNAWQPSKLYYTATPLERIKKRFQMAIDRGEKPRMNPEFLGTPEHLITTVIDVSQFIPTKFEALACHTSQMGPNSFFRQLPPDQIADYFGHEYYVCAKGCLGPEGKETDLFEGIR
ncbi:MAG: hypothetical protein FP816_16285 [Desulfobacteraceae bacterium]|nr:hypothetical protein [Desulfobacteraceae bacterium]MBU4002875.1 PIG-L family deacetylase [Pseudomonadota bacterium]